MAEFPRALLPKLHELAARLLDSRKTNAPHEPFARALLVGFEDVCEHMGLDALVAQLPDDLEDDPAVRAALVAQLEAAELDRGGPRNARPGKVADCVVAALGLTLVDTPDTTIAVDAGVRDEITAAVASIVDVEVAPARLRDAIIGHARPRCDEAHILVFDKIAAQLDERGMRMMKQPKVPLDASQAVQRLLTEARHAVLGHTVTTALDRAKAILERANAAAAARIDEPISLRVTPRDVLIARVVDDRVSKVPATVTAAIVDGLTELARLTWHVPEAAARTYSPRETFAVGDAIDHPKFGRGTVTAVTGQKMDVEFAETTTTLVHARK